MPLEVEEGAAVGEFWLEADETVDFVLEAADPESSSPVAAPDWVDDAYTAHGGVLARWSDLSTYRGRWREMVNRSALVMKLLTSSGHGSIAAAGTFGLPETAGGERNWDYRYTWIRDASFTAAALVRLGYGLEASDFLHWVHDRYASAKEPGKLQIMYAINGESELTEETLEHLEGYQRSSPVRIGNGAYDQLQLDIYGELLYLVELFDGQVERISFDLWRHLSESVDWVCANWHRPDEGIWEIRGGRQEFLYSRLMDWVCLDRAMRIARRRGLPAPHRRWEQTRDQIHDHIYDEMYDEERNAFVQHKGSKTLDASCLLMPMLDFISSRDPRWLSTLDAVGRELADDALVYRYLTEDAAADGLTGTEGTFAMCSFWYVECLARAGDVDRARLLFEKMHGYGNHLGLYSEEMDLTGHHLGNFPQAFTHLGLVSAALYLDERAGQAQDRSSGLGRNTTRETSMSEEREQAGGAAGLPRRDERQGRRPSIRGVHIAARLRLPLPGGAGGGDGGSRRTSRPRCSTSWTPSTTCSFTVEQLLADGDRVVHALVGPGRAHRRLPRGIPPTRVIPATGKEISMSATDIYRVVDGRIRSRSGTPSTVTTSCTRWGATTGTSRPAEPARPCHAPWAVRTPPG